MTAIRDAALRYARAWPVCVCRPGAKEPLTPHGVKDATCDPQLIRRWFDRWPDANLAVACGSPGPQVLDVDDLGALDSRRMRPDLDTAPSVATARGRHFYFAGTDAGTVVLDYGELRGSGSYVLAPPSIHPSGREYVWLTAPTRPLAPVPGSLAKITNRAGCGDHDAPVARVPHGQRHPYLTSFAVHLLRAGITDWRRIAAHLQCEFELSCEPLPPPRPGEFDDLAKWATRTLLADRERGRAEFAARWAKPKGQAG